MTLSSLLCKPNITVEVRHTVLYCDVVVVMASSLYSEDAVLLSLSLSLSLSHTHTHTHIHTHTHTHTSQLVLNHSDICIQSTGTCVTISGEARPNKTQTRPKPVCRLLARAQYPV